MIEKRMDQNQNPNSFPDNMDSPKAQDTATVVPDNKKDPPLEGSNSTKIVACGIPNMILDHQNYINSSLRQNSMVTL